MRRIVCLAGGIAVIGCTRTASPPVAPSPSPAASPTPFPVQIHGTQLESTVGDGQGKTIAVVRARQGTLVPKGADALGSLLGQTAVLYGKDGKPSVELTGDRVAADPVEHVVIATGNVHARSRTPGATTTVRSDTMTWRYADETIAGRGHVVMTQGADSRLAADAFTSDTAFTRVELTFEP
jgi:hypothetical protein